MRKRLKENLERKVGKIGKKMDEGREQVIRELEEKRSWEIKEINKRVEDIGEKIKKMEF